ncbi:MAG: molybdopterin-binding protein [Firmicutes bacterium]|nr:molybdopterin-binding protein [Bacillota bacterium]
MKKIKVENSVGTVLAHDLTKIVPGKFKGARFKKGHIITKEDIEILKDMGKNHIYSFVVDESKLHENQSAIRMGKAAIGNGVYTTEPSEGKVNIKSKYKGLLKVNKSILKRVNDIDLIMLATLHNNTIVEKDQKVAATRIIPLVIEKEKIEVFENICRNEGSIVSVKPMYNLKTGIIVTGSEVYCGRIKDKFGDILKEKIDTYKAEYVGIKYAPDDPKEISKAILELIDMGAEVILASGGMSVDADDVTPSAIRDISTEVISYGSPVLPGSMFMVAYKEGVTILGIPGCAMYHKTTVFDVIYPRVLAKEKLSKQDITSLAYGGLCMNCEVCNYPICPLGKI